MAAQRATTCLDEGVLEAFARGRLDGAGVSEVESHLADCAVCQASLTRLALVVTGATADFAASGTVQTAQAPLQSDAFRKPRSPDSEIPEIGTIVDHRYRVEHVLGRGGMGSVVAATHVGLRQRVALKVLKLVGEQAAARFLREGRTLAQLNNEHIVRVYDSGELPNGLPYIVMEHLDGADLARLIAEGPIAIGDAVIYVRQACEALMAAHAAGIVHRDLKPSNLFLVRSLSTSAPLIKVLDFGISKSMQRDAAASATDTALTLTGTGDVIGSPRYMSPEQLQGKSSIDARTDIWSLGVILYELLTGVPPFPQRDFAAVAIAIATERPKPPRALRPEIPEALQAIVMRCLHKDPGQRFQSMQALTQALEPFGASAASVLGSTSRRGAAVGVVSRRTGWLFAAALVLVVGGALLVRYRSGPAATREESVSASTQPQPPAAGNAAQPTAAVAGPPSTVSLQPAAAGAPSAAGKPTTPAKTNPRVAPAARAASPTRAASAPRKPEAAPAENAPPPRTNLPGLSPTPD